MGVLRAALLSVLALVFLGGNAEAASREYQLKAVFLLNFSRFVEWPVHVEVPADAPFAVCVLGENPFGDDLAAVMRGESVKGRPIVVHSVANAGEAAQCQILFIHRSAERQLSAVLAALAGTSTLTVSDADGAAQRGAMIGLVTQNNRVRLRINVDAARAAGLTISSNLLRSAEIVGTRREALL